MSRTRTFAHRTLPEQVYGLGAAVAAFQRTTIDAVAVLSFLTNPATGAFEYRHK
jgi:hypothetical protein